MNHNLLLISTFVLLFSACSTKEATVGEVMMKSATSVEQDVNLKKKLSTRWEKGSKLLKKGQKQVEKGEDLISDGESNINKGKKLMRESEKEFREKFPDTPLLK